MVVPPFTAHRSEQNMPTHSIHDYQTRFPSPSLLSRFKAYLFAFLGALLWAKTAPKIDFQIGLRRHTNAKEGPPRPNMGAHMGPNAQIFGFEKARTSHSGTFCPKPQHGYRTNRVCTNLVCAQRYSSTTRRRNIDRNMDLIHCQVKIATKTPFEPFLGRCWGLPGPQDG